MQLTLSRPVRSWLAALACGAMLASAAPVLAQSTGFAQAVAQLSAKDQALAAYYKAANYDALWTGRGNRERQRVRELVRALEAAPGHGLPAGRYDVAGLKALASSAKSEADLAKLEVAYSRAFLDYVHDVQSGVLVPRRVARGIERDAPRRDPARTLAAFAKSSPSGFIDALPPQTGEYAALLAEKARLERLAGGAGWGPKVQASALQKGQSSPAVAQMAARLSAMGYGRGGSAAYDDAVVQQVAAFQRDHGLSPDGVAGKGTLAEINKEPADRLASVLAAMERERWMNFPLGKRHVWVNIPDFTAKIIDNGKVTLETRSVVGQNQSTHRSPEFSDVMEYMVINPTWNVPRSIVVNEYLPMMKANPNAAGQLQLIDQSGRSVSRGAVDFASYSASNFPYGLKEPPSTGNALGTVKFMFPNPYNIYLHDTPSKSLFGRETRAFSHGCIRLADPHDFAYTLLAQQTRDPKGFFQSKLATRQETTVRLEHPVPVHIGYRTAFAPAGKGPFQYRRDVYGRDAAVYSALVKAGVSIGGVRG
ncbi:murein L,D-transpeptidase [Poseidonocella sp. HB161398]|uniref:L,D-transpeptidase family protein n=1 Tax=Poseidonocella sp. HB161398 TaxID=2320855 RepID=UPI001108B066|nr:L,D-transpeptidase family protein [Poseidonocella sp. HB161398]